MVPFLAQAHDTAGGDRGAAGERRRNVQVVSGGVALTATGHAAMSQGARSGKGTGISDRTC
jgi:hypothetical protein